MAGEDSDNQPWSENLSDEESAVDSQITKVEPEDVEEKLEEQDLNNNKEFKSEKGKTQGTSRSVSTDKYKKAVEDIFQLCRSVIQPEVEEDSGDDSGEDSDVSDTTDD